VRATENKNLFIGADIAMVFSRSGSGVRVSLHKPVIETHDYKQTKNESA
jgi:hypothetical protein